MYSLVLSVSTVNQLGHMSAAWRRSPSQDGTTTVIVAVIGRTLAVWLSGSAYMSAILATAWLLVMTPARWCVRCVDECPILPTVLCYAI